jgi:acetoacetyl-CoA reductase
MGNIGQANYVAAKGGIIAFTKTAAMECARYGILVNAIAPGFVRTRMTASIRPDITEKIVSQIPLRRYAEPEEIARLARFLVSEENTYITGQTVNINGGLYV